VNLKTYQAFTMAQALAAVRQDLGIDAVILNTRSFKRGGFMGLGRRTIVEVTATPAKAAAASASFTARSTRPVSARPPQAAAATRSYAATEAKPLNRRPVVSPSSGAAPDRDRQRAQLLAQILLERQTRAAAPVQAAPHPPPVQPAPAATSPAVTNERPAPAPSPSHSIRSASGDSLQADRMATESPVGAAPQAGPAVATATLPAARRFVLRSPNINGTATPAATAQPIPSSVAMRSSTAPKRHAVPSILSNDLPVEPNRTNGSAAMAEARVMQDELQAIKSMVGQVLARQTPANGTPSNAASSTMPQHLFDLYLKLVSQDVSDELADQICNDVRDELNGTDLQDSGCVRTAVMRHLADFIPVALEPVTDRPADGRPLTIALVGPTGVGKTTTLAKLAAAFKLRHKKCVGMITADTYRIAAVDQLRTYANIIGIPLQVALAPDDMTRAVNSLAGCDVILIDTAGRSQNDAGRIDELRAFVAAASPHEVHLVLSSTAGEKVLLREAEAFSAVGIDKIVLTKLDEAVSFGMLVNVLRRLGKQLSFFTTGQEVPDHLEIGRSDRLADLILGGALQS